VESPFLVIFRPEPAKMGRYDFSWRYGQEQVLRLVVFARLLAALL
jgi:hypothetical protein